ncbi:hypothetical protein DSO57_1035455 [Entomophthora muscae]|uniref:Uncharacterized protein n=1 Tax=Entomophthora muscae TaxID=34485 RepID=A0ACC2TLA3_9FUNG|nr:hypothetical protein DSO57_1035455 [Entomophthora muscae]
MGKEEIELGKLEAPECKEVAPLPDGGFGWVVVAVSFMVAFIVFGFNYTYSVLVEHYDETLVFQGKKASLEYVGTVNMAVLNISCLVTGRLDDKFGHRRCILGGAIVYGLGLLMSSFATQVWHLILTQGVMMGASGSIVTIATISAPIQWFDKRRGLASGISMSGCGIGGFVMAPLMTKLLSVFEVNTILQALSIFSCVVLVFAACVIKDQPVAAPEDEIPWYDFSILKQPRFMLLLMGNTVATFGYLVPMYKISEYAQKAGLSKGNASLILSCINGASSISRIVGGILADKIGANNTLIASLLIMGLSCSIMWPISTGFPSLLIFGFVFGFGVGGFVSLPPVVNSKLFGVHGLSTTTGIIYFSAAFPALVGVPIATAMTKANTVSPADYIIAIEYAGLTALLGSAFIVWLKFLINCNPLSKN